MNVLLVAIFLATCQACDNFSFHLTSPAPITEDGEIWTVGVQRVAFSLNITCEGGSGEWDYRYKYQRLYFLRRNETVFDISEVVVFVIRSYGSWCYNSQPNRVTLTCAYTANYTWANISIFNASFIETNASIAIVKYFRKSDVLFRSHQILFKHCSTDTFPSDLHALVTGDGYVNSQTIPAVCRVGEPFLGNAVYTKYLNVPCGPHAEWTPPHYACSRSCVEPSDPTLRLVTGMLQQTRYRVGTTLSYVCNTGLLFVDQKYRKKYNTTCQDSGGWTVEREISCWTGLTTDFSVPKTTVTAGTTLLFLCKSGEFRSSLMIGDYRRVSLEVNAWTKMTVTSQHNGMEATCEIADDRNHTISRQKLLLNVLYPAAALGDIESQYLTVGEPGHITVPVRSNPTFDNDDVTIAKNGTGVSNFYVESEGELHEIVIHFTEVEENDLGEYVIRVTSYPPVAAVLVIKLTVGKRKQVITEPEQHSSSENAIIVGLATCLALVIVGAVAAVILIKRRSGPNKPKASKPAAERPTEPVVQYRPEEPEEDVPYHNYEDIDKPSTNTDHQAYENVQHGPTGNMAANVYTPEEPGRRNGGGRVAMMPGRTNKPLGVGQPLPQAQRPRGRADAYRPSGPQYNVGPDLHGQMEGYERMEFNPGF